MNTFSKYVNITIIDDHPKSYNSSKYKTTKHLFSFKPSQNYLNTYSSIMYSSAARPEFINCSQ